jgi:hypothetical protein
LLRAEVSAQGLGSVDVSFEETEEIVTRLAWCGRNNITSEDSKLQKPTETISVPLPPSEPTTTLTLDFARLSEPAEQAFFESSDSSSLHDIHDQPLPLLLYNALLALPIDVRKICMARIMITGGVSHIPGIKSRMLEELKLLVERRGWDPIRNYGKVSKRSNRTTELDENTTIRPESGVTDGARDEDHATSSDENAEESPPIAAAFREQEPDPILKKIQDHADKRNPPSLEGEIRAIETLGAWAGGSLMASLRIKGVVEVERESFMQHGLSGAAKEKEMVSKASQRQSLAPGGKVPGGEKSSWTLGGWA